MDFNTVQIPESLLVHQAQQDLRNLRKNYPLPIHTWRLIVRDYMNEIEDMYSKQIVNDSKNYFERIKEAEKKSQAEDMND